MRARTLLLAALVLLALPLTGARAASAQAWQARFEMRAPELQGALDDLARQGFVPLELSAVDDGGGVLHAAVWRHEPGIAWRAWYGATSAELQARADELAPLGFVPAQITGYVDGAETRYAHIWRREGGVAWEARHDLDAQELRRTSDRLAEAGYVPASLSGYTVDGEPRFAGVWRRRDGVAWEARVDLSEAAYQAHFDRLSPQGYVPVDLSAYRVDGELRFAALWERVSGVRWEARHHLPLAKHAAFTREQEARGYAPYVVAPYLADGEVRYAGAWRYAAAPARLADAPAGREPDPVPAGTRARRLPIAPVVQQTRVWCWLAVGEMLFRHYGVPNVNPGGNFQCGIIGRISDPRSPCASDCFACVMPSGSNYATLAMVSSYARMTAGRTVQYAEGGAISPGVVVANLDAGRPVMAGISYHRRIADADAEHVALIVGYELRDGALSLIVNDPFPYGPGENPFLRSGGVATAPHQYRIGYADFRDRVFWHWSVFDLRM